MNNRIRRRKLYEYLKKNHSLQVSDAAEMMNVSSMTIRRDLLDMEKEGLIIRFYGKAILKNDTANEIPFRNRTDTNYESKRQMAQKAIELLTDNITIFLDGSTSCYVFSTLIPTQSNIKVLCGNLNAAYYLQNHSNLQIILPGGIISEDSNSIDIESAQFIPECYVDYAFVSCGGFSVDGLVDSNLSGSVLRSFVTKNAQKVVLLADHTKLCKPGLFYTWKWSNVDYFITDIKPDDGVLRTAEKNGVCVMWYSEH